MLFQRPKSKPTRKEVLDELRKALLSAADDAIDGDVHLRDIVLAFEDATDQVRLHMVRSAPMAKR
jgi:hypothetical protein